MSTFNSASATIIKVTFQGLTTAGAVSITGLEVGDVVMRIIPDGFDSGYEEVVSVADQLQQTSMFDWSSVTVTAYLFRGV